MTTISRFSRMLAGFLLFGWLALVGCNQAVADVAPEPEPTAEIEVPTQVVLVRDTAVEFIRAAAAICVPPAGVDWRASKPENAATAGAHVYRFANGDCTISVAYPDPAPAEVVYYVGLYNTTTDFCWQGFLNANGDILSSGYETVDPEAVNPAITYCQAQGYQYQIITKPDGELCGACVFADNTACNAWDYFYGNCAPGDNPLP